MSLAELPDYRCLRLEHVGPLTWIVFNRPDKANAFSAALLDEFSDALERLKTVGGPVLAIRGEGRGFSSGYDLGEVGKVVASPDPVADRERLDRNVARWLAVWDHPKPVIAAVHGYCAAGAAQLCVFADITIVTECARISEPTVPIGGGYIAPLWVPLVGPKRAKEFAFVPGNSIDGPTAVSWGWANHCVASADLVPAVEGLAARIALTPPQVLRMKKLAINAASEAGGLRAAARGVAANDALLHLCPDVAAVRRRIAEQGLKATMAEYRVPPTTPLQPYSLEIDRGGGHG